mmetsp:Transcript_11065/g.39065  ORF Transcript_11065/g.39065 Transcript_11065/m.39065 type:complete len:310 (-) Transcript_11065:2126-3055(-)
MSAAGGEAPATSPLRSANPAKPVKPPVNPAAGRSPSRATRSWQRPGSRPLAWLRARRNSAALLSPNLVTSNSASGTKKLWAVSFCTSTLWSVAPMPLLSPDAAGGSGDTATSGEVARAATPSLSGVATGPLSSQAGAAPAALAARAMAEARDPLPKSDLAADCSSGHSSSLFSILPPSATEAEGSEGGDDFSTMRPRKSKELSSGPPPEELENEGEAGTVSSTGARLPATTLAGMVIPFTNCALATKETDAPIPAKQSENVSNTGARLLATLGGMLCPLNNFELAAIEAEAPITEAPKLAPAPSPTNRD